MDQAMAERAARRERAGTRTPEDQEDPGAQTPPSPQQGDPVARALYRLAFLGLVVLLVWLTLGVDLVVLFGVFLAVWLRMAALRLRALTGLGAGWSLAVVVTAIFGVIGGIAYFFADAIISQMGELSRRLPEAIHFAAQKIDRLPFGHELIAHLNAQALIGTNHPIAQIFGMASNAAQIGVGLFVVLFVGLYLAAEAEHYQKGVLRLLPRPRRARGAEILEEVGFALWEWLLGRLVSMVALGTMTGVGLWIIGVPVARALGLLAGLLVFVPYLGGFVAAIPGVLLGLAVGGQTAITVVFLYMGVHAVEAYILVPLTQRRAAHLPPALTLSTQLILGALAGILGLLLATPIVAASLVLVRTIYIEDRLGDRGDAPSL